jgi:hypothetical protein
MRSLLNLRGVLALLALVVLCGSIALAQETTATVSGTVKDESGAVVPGVTITVKNVATGVARTVTTEAEGRYTVPQLPPGNYQLEAGLAGFQTEVRSGIELTIGRRATLDVTLKVGSVGEKVEVVGEAPLVETASAGLTGLVGDKQIRDLPLNGRNFVSLTLLETGVVESRAAGTSSVVGGGVKLNFNGARSDYNNYMMDGTSMNSVNQQAIGGASGQAMGVETIQEFQVLTTNFSAEFGRAGGGVINIVSKSGTNELHGSLFEFLRNDKLDARRFFDVGDVPPFKRNQFGLVLGGPLKKDKTFIFGGYEGLRERLGQTLIANVPTAEARLGQLPAPLPPVTVAESVKPYLLLWPLPNGTRRNSDGTGDYISALSQPTTQNFAQIRIDQNQSDKDSFFVRYTIDDSTLDNPQPVPTYLATDTSRSQFLTLAETRIFSAKLLNSFRFGFNRSTVKYDQAPINPLAADPNLAFIPNLPVPFLGNLGISGVAEPGGQTNRPKHRLDNVFQFLDTVSINTDRHSLKIGGEYQRIQTNENDTNRGQGVYSFPSLTAFLQGAPTAFDSPTPGDTFIRGWRHDLVAAFVQDDFRIKPHFTWNIGLRWEFTTDPTEVNGRTSHYENLMGLSGSGPIDRVVVGGPLYKLPKANFGPRTGFAWDVNGDGKTSIRGGFGQYYQMLFRNYFFSSRILPPFLTNISANPPLLQFPHPFGGLSTSSTTAPQMEQWEDNSQPYILQWNLNVQRQLDSATVVTLGYVGTRGLHLGRFTSPNVAIPTIQPDGRFFYPAGSQRRDPNFTNLTFKSLSSESRYNALQLKVARRASKGLQIQGSYTWSHSMDYSSSQLSGDYSNTNAFPQNPYDIKNTEWANSSFDLRHVLTVNYTYTLPFGANMTGVGGKLLQGWQTTGIFNVTPGVPINVENASGLNRDRSGGNSNSSRPDLRPGFSVNPIEGTTAGCPGVAAGQKLGTPDLYFDPCAYQLQELGYYGNVGRNTLTGPGLMTFNFGLTKNTAIGEGRNLQFRAEAFNLFNRANFDIPAHTVFNNNNGVRVGTAGRITNVSTSGRQLQFGLKLTF